MRTKISLIVLLLSILYTGPVFAAGVISANNFQCSATPAKSGSLVECIGQFPGVTGIFGATGFDVVQISYSPDNQRRYYYMSETGCLILTAPDKTSVAMSAAKKQMKFASFMEAMQWCYQK